MSLRQLYQSDPLRYAPQNLSVPVYLHPEFRQNGRVYDESLERINAFYIDRDNTPAGTSRYGALMLLYTVKSPGVVAAAQFFDWRNGHLAASDEVSPYFIGMWNLLGYYLTTYVATTTRNEFFRLLLGVGGNAFVLTPVDKWTNPIGPPIPQSHWQTAYSPTAPFAVSIEHNWMVAGSSDSPMLGRWLSHTFASWLHVYRWGDGQRVLSFPCLRRPLDVFPEDGYFVWVVCQGGYIQLVDVRTGQTAGVMRVDFQSSSPLPHVRGVYDRYQRRILLMEKTPDATDGAATTVIRGYWPNELPRRITAPIPIERPRVGARTRFIARCVGDLGLPMPGVQITADSDDGSEDLAIATQTLGTDAAGYALGFVDGRAEGADAVNLEAAV